MNRELLLLVDALSREKNVPKEIAAQILEGGAHLYGFTDDDFRKAAAVA